MTGHIHSIFLSIYGVWTHILRYVHKNDHIKDNPDEDNGDVMLRAEFTNKLLSIVCRLWCGGRNETLGKRKLPPPSQQWMSFFLYKWFVCILYIQISQNFSVILYILKKCFKGCCHFISIGIHCHNGKLKPLLLLLMKTWEKKVQNCQTNML